MVNGKWENIKPVEVPRYPGGKFSSKGNFTDLCKDRVDRAKGSTFQLIVPCREVKYRVSQKIYKYGFLNIKFKLEILANFEFLGVSNL